MKLIIEVSEIDLEIMKQRRRRFPRVTQYSEGGEGRCDAQIEHDATDRVMDAVFEALNAEKERRRR